MGQILEVPKKNHFLIEGPPEHLDHYSLTHLDIGALKVPL